MTNPRHLRLGEGVWAGAQRNVGSLEPLTDVVLESKLNQADWIHWWDEGGNLPDCVLPNPIKVISRGNGKEQSPVLPRRPSPTNTATSIRVGRGIQSLSLPVIEMV